MSQDFADIVVVGSGPAGIAAARALLEQGLAVTLIDAGREAPASVVQARADMASAPPGDWNREQVAERNRRSLRERDGVPLKTVFGSDFPYHFDSRVIDDGAVILGSHARGGLSNAWGASILPLSERDMADWPLTADDLAPHYAAVLDWLPAAQGRDDLAEDYPLHAADRWQPQLSRQGRALHDDLLAGRATLRDNGIVFGRARLALSECVYCGQCLHGCPYEFIYSSTSTMAGLLDNPNFTYVGNTVVDALEEQGDAVLLHTRSGGTPHTLRCGRVYLGTGVLHTALLMLQLLKVSELRILDSAYALLPFLRYRRTAGVEQESLFTLPQFFMEADLAKVSPRNVHLQWYAYNDFYKQELRRKLGPLRHVVPDALQRLFVERMWSIQTFLHSDDSPQLTLRTTGADRYALSADENSRSQVVMRATVERLRRLAPTLGGRVISPLIRDGIPGGSFHSGGSLPMSAQPGELQSDLAGRPHGLRRVHIVDSSVFPNIASSTITLSVMANAHRIASGHHLYA